MSKTIAWIMSLIAIGAVTFAAYLLLSKSDTVSTSATPTPKVSNTPTPTPTGSPMPTASPSATPSMTRTFSASQPLAVPNEVETLGAGMALSTIATNHGLTVTQLAALNGITDPNKVFEGQTLIIPDDATADNFTILFTLNKQRLAKEQQKIQAGTSSLYADPITAAQTDLRGIYGLAADTPYSTARSEERRVGKECRSRWSPYH